MIGRGELSSCGARSLRHMRFSKGEHSMRRFSSSRSFRLACLVMLTGLLLGSVAGTLAQEPPYYSDTMEPAQEGGTVRFLLYEDPNTLNPIAGATSIAYQVIN